MTLPESPYVYVDYNALPYEAQAREYQLRAYEMKKFPSNQVFKMNFNFNKTVTDYVDLIEFEKGFGFFRLAS